THQPYQVHLQAVAKLVAQFSDDPKMIAAAWLHDVVEDTSATFSDIQREFGDEIAGLVADLTDVSKPSDGNRAARKALDRAHTAQASPQAKTIKLADLIDNCRDICKHDPDFGQVFVREAILLMEVLDQGDPDLFQLARQTIAQCMRQLDISAEHSSGDEEFVEPGSTVTAIGGAQSTRLFLEAFRAGHIAEPLRSFDQERPLEEIAQAMAQSHIEVAGARQTGRVTGFFQLTTSTDGSASVAISAFSKYQVLDHDAPISRAIEVLTKYEHCFVRGIDGIGAVITRACMQKPYVRMWLFGIVTLFEMYMSDYIARRWPDESWTGLISAGRLDKTRLLLEERRRRGQNVTLTDCLQFSDKGHLLMSDPEQLALFGLKSKGAAQQIIKEIETLRNDLAHAQDIVSRNWPQIARLARRVEEGQQKQR
ncbi:MAG: HD domain-containing protein, partial [Desulfobacteraceae bacterium]|nr:HD domain-containing protein [Desulfobacteraceae bacterium]